MEDVRVRRDSSCAHIALPAQVWRPAAQKKFPEVVSQGTLMSKVSTQALMEALAHAHLWHLRDQGRRLCVLGGRLEKGAVKPGEKVWQCSSRATKWSGRGPAFRKLIGMRCVTDATSRVPKNVFRKLWTIHVHSLRLCALTDYPLGALPRRWFSCTRQVQSVHPECLHSGNAPPVRRTGMARWPRGSEHVEDKCRRQDTWKTFIVENIDVHVMFLRPDHLGGRDVRVTVLGRSEVLRFHGRTCARRGVFS